jgi:DNA-binding GntR family transcriptional regulator
MPLLAVTEPPRPIHRIPLHEQARMHLRQMIVRGELAPGANIGEVELCRTLGISRTPLREALKLLAAEGLIDLASHRGAFVAPLKVGEVTNTIEVVARLEQLGAELAAASATEADLALLRVWQDRMEAEQRARRRNPYFEINQRIHRAIVAMGGNQALVAAHEMLFGRIERVRFLAIGSLSRWEESINEHREVLASLAARDPVRAGTALAAHVRHTGQRMAVLLDKDNAPPEAKQPYALKRPLKSRRTP